MAMDCKIIDTTLREGEQTPGVTFTFEQKKKIIDGVINVGVSEIELGVSSPFMPDIEQLTDYCRCKHPDMQLSLWSRCREEDILHASKLVPDVLSLSIPVSDINLEKKLGWDRSWAIGVMLDSIALTQRLGMCVSVGFEDATRAELEYLAEMVELAQKAGVVRVRLADTVGVASPVRIVRLVSELSERLSTCELAIHTHNDFGMATANAIAALEAGVVWTDATVLGLGERAGCARLEELVGYLALVDENATFHPEKLKSLSIYVSGITGREIAKCQPLVGEDIFACETGLHLQGLQVEPQIYEPYNPKRVGAERKMIFGAKSGRKAVALLQKSSK